jgi:hypothetical protein
MMMMVMSTQYMQCCTACPDRLPVISQHVVATGEPAIALPKLACRRITKIVGGGNFTLQRQFLKSARLLLRIARLDDRLGRASMADVQNVASQHVQHAVQVSSPWKAVAGARGSIQGNASNSSGHTFSSVASLLVAQKDYMWAAQMFFWSNREGDDATNKMKAVANSARPYMDKFAKQPHFRVSKMAKLANPNAVCAGNSWLFDKSWFSKFRDFLRGAEYQCTRASQCKCPRRSVLFNTPWYFERTGGTPARKVSIILLAHHEGMSLKETADLANVDAQTVTVVQGLLQPQLDQARMEIDAEQMLAEIGRKSKVEVSDSDESCGDSDGELSDYESVGVPGGAAVHFEHAKYRVHDSWVPDHWKEVAQVFARAHSFKDARLFLSLVCFLLLILAHPPKNNAQLSPTCRAKQIILPILQKCVWTFCARRRSRSINTFLLDLISLVEL